MPVLVAAADTALGRPLVERLAAEGGQVRGYVTGGGDVAALRAAGAFVATGDLDDEGRLDAAMTGVHTVVHAVQGVFAESAARLVTEALTVLEAARKAGVVRVVLLSVPGADPSAGDPLRAAWGRIEQEAAASPTQTLVVRASLIDQAPLRDVFATTPPTPAQRAMAVAPVVVEDLLEGVVALDAARSETTTGHALFAADGPVTTLDAYLREVAVGVGEAPMVGRVYTPAARVPLLWTSLSSPWVSDDTGLADLWAFAGVESRGPVP
jgi:uncharacterized protein YbjT (DUF2867 family)